MIHEFGGDIIYTGNEIGVIVVHGITVSPSYMKGVIEPLHKAGFSIFAPVLAGHGSKQEDLKNYSYQDWIKSVENAHNVLTDMGCTKIFVVGHSMGGLMASYLAEHQKVEGLVTISMPYYIFGYLKTKLFSRFFKNKYAQMNEAPIPEGMYRYEKMSGKSAGDLLKAMKVINTDLAKVVCPAIVVQGREDKTVIPSSAKHIYHSISSAEKELIMIDAPHQCTQKPEHCDQYMPQVVQFIKNHI